VCVKACRKQAARWLSRRLVAAHSVPAPGESLVLGRVGPIGGRRFELRKLRCWCIACGKGSGGSRRFDSSIPKAVMTGDVSRSISRRRTQGRKDRGASWPGQSLGGRVHGCSWYVRHQPHYHLGRQCRQRLAAAIVDSRLRSRTSVRAGVSAGRGGLDAARYRSRIRTIRRMLVTTGQLQKLVTGIFSSFSVRSRAHLTASSVSRHATHALTGGLAPRRGQGV
jgi:hypothetical protein